MAECSWAILCDYSFLDVSRKMCLIGIFDRVWAQAVPTTHHQAALALKLIGDPNEKVAMKVEIVRPAGGVLATLGGEVTLGDTGSGEFNMNIAGLPLPDFGLYAFNIYLNEKLEKTVGFSVDKPQSPPKVG